ncbi:hypothetical protein F4804DRAFT_328393 [Jackrogersella minutella]|nr:hypothetical protein F4804DRAFT_328393 [Jackrogersella minutella]
MPCRKPHKNSHHGCTQCKSKRVKCDQEQPTCARCRKKGQDCTYRHIMSSYDPFRNYNDTNSGSISSTASSTIDMIPNPSPAAPTVPSPSLATMVPLRKGLSMFDPITEQLFHHYATEVSPIFTLSEVPIEVLSSFHDAVIKHSFEHPHVYHAMLTVSALHLASLTPSLGSSSQTRSPHLVTALAHKTSAIETLRLVINSITAPTCEPALASSGLLTICAFALLHAGGVSDIIDLLAQIMVLYRGTLAIFRLGRQDPRAGFSNTIPRLRQSIISAIIGERPWPSAEAAVDKILIRISGLSEATDDAKQNKSVLLNAGFALKVALRRVAGAKGVYNVACMWLAVVHPAFNEGIKTRDPLSLILLAHWVISLRYVDHIWWVRGWPKMTVQAVWQEVGEQHPDLMEWVLEETRHGGSLFMGT